MKSAERHWIVKGTSKFNQHRYFRNVLTLKWNPENVLHWGDVMFFGSTGNKSLWIPSRLLEIRFDQGRLLKILTTDIKK